MIRISLTTPTFNQAATIRETIESVLRQDYTEIDYWVIDAGSTDGTLDILREYESDPRFHWLSEKDEGQGDAINKGLARATGDIYNWINSDDYLEPGALRKVAEAFEKNPALDIVSGKTSEFRGNPPEIYNYLTLQLRDTPENTITVGVFCQPSTFWKTSVFRELGGLDKSLHFTLDWHLWVKYLTRHGQGHVLLIDDVLAHFRQHPAAKTTKDSSKFYHDADRVFHDLLVDLEAPAEWINAITVPDGASKLDFEFGPQFDRSLYLGKYCERLVRVNRRKNPAIAKEWIKRSFDYKPGLTWWRIKMAARLAFR